MEKGKTKRARGFTLVELLLVIAVIGLLSGLLFSAVFRMTKTADDERNRKNKQILQAAITEYRHDMGAWPVDPDDLKNVKTKKEEYKVAGSAKTRHGLKKTLCYGSLDNVHEKLVGPNNDVVVSKLLSGSVGGTAKSFIDLRSFMTTAEKDVRDFAIGNDVETRSAYQVWRDDRTDGAGIPLVYMVEVVRCPVCGGVQAVPESGVCCNDGKKGRQKCDDEGSPHVFTTRELQNRERRPLPYKIAFDFVADECVVLMVSDSAYHQYD